MGTYSYDPYGGIIEISHNDNYKDKDGILEKNPFRYRSYYFDTETGWYYLNSRYYDPQVKRFINGDSTQLLTNSPDNLMQYNLFMYCNGDPVDNTDSSGRAVDKAILIATLIGAMTGLGQQFISDVIGKSIAMLFDSSHEYEAYWQDYVGAAVGGALLLDYTMATGVQAIGGLIGGAVSSSVSSGLKVLTEPDYNKTSFEIMIEAYISGGIGFCTQGFVANTNLPSSIRSGDFEDIIKTAIGEFIDSWPEVGIDTIIKMQY